MLFNFQEICIVDLNWSANFKRDETTADNFIGKGTSFIHVSLCITFILNYKLLEIGKSTTKIKSPDFNMQALEIR